MDYFKSWIAIKRLSLLHAISKALSFRLFVSVMSMSDLCIKAQNTSKKNKNKKINQSPSEERPIVCMLWVFLGELERYFWYKRQSPLFCLKFNYFYKTQMFTVKRIFGKTPLRKKSRPVPTSRRFVPPGRPESLINP